jgi:putative transposase
MRKEHLRLKDADRSYLESLLSKGVLSAKVFKRATGLLELHRGRTLQSVASTLQVNYNTVAAWRDNYKEHGLDALFDRPRSGRPIEIDENLRARIIELARSEPLEGYTRWSLRSLAEQCVVRGLIEQISHSQIATILREAGVELA